uniref:Uncharacterized protein n=1 Tax=Anguilla anguilla TaxID=7936 RepID=A0A0E9VZY9_ANGAN
MALTLVTGAQGMIPVPEVRPLLITGMQIIITEHSKCG